MRIVVHMVPAQSAHRGRLYVNVSRGTGVISVRVSPHVLLNTAVVTHMAALWSTAQLPVAAFLVSKCMVINIQRLLYIGLD